jgi:hypothetical protein
MSVYKMAINNTANYLSSKTNTTNIEANHPDSVTIFEVSNVLAIAFCKSPNDIMADILNAKLLKGSD